MKGTTFQLILLAGLGGWLGAAAPLVAQTSQAPKATQTTQDPQGFLRDYTIGPAWFPTVLQPYHEQTVAPAAVENSSRLRSLIHDGKLELSLADALALALENNLDIGVQRYLIPMSKSDVLRASGGQATRGEIGRASCRERV